jgi:Na+-transporting NADH:ubiquinone oxidoreductase subunit NqrE
MTEFEENNQEQLKAFLKKLNELVDEFHPNIYLLNGVFKGVQTIEIAILNELNKDKEI